MEKELLFKVMDADTQHEWRIYVDGSVAGFGENVLIFNYHPLRDIELIERLRAQLTGHAAPPTIVEPVEKPEAPEFST